MSSPPVGTSCLLTPYHTLVTRANELKSSHPVAAYYLRLQYLQIALHFRPNCHAEEKAYAITLLEEIESEKAQLPAGTDDKTAASAMRALAVQIFERARAADQPESFPSTALQWTYDAAPKVARGLHAAAVLLDCVAMFGGAPLSEEDKKLQSGCHGCSQQLAGQLASALKTPSVVPSDWKPQPADLLEKPPPPPAPPPPLFPSVPTPPASPPTAESPDISDAHMRVPASDGSHPTSGGIGGGRRDLDGKDIKDALKTAGAAAGAAGVVVGGVLGGGVILGAGAASAAAYAATQSGAAGDTAARRARQRCTRAMRSRGLARSTRWQQRSPRRGGRSPSGTRSTRWRTPWASR